MDRFTERSSSILPRDLVTHILVVDALLEEGEVDEALRLARMMALRHPEDPDAAIFLCVTLLKADRPEEALAGAERARLSELDDSSAQLVCGQVRMATDRHSEAIPFLRRAVRLRPESIHAWTLLALAYSKLELWSDTIAVCREALAHGEDRVLHLALGNALLSLGNLDEAIGTLKKARGLYGRSAEVTIVLAMAYAMRGDERKALKLVREVEASRPQPSTQLPIGAIQMLLGNSAGAARAWKRLRRVDPELSRALLASIEQQEVRE